MCEAYRTIPQCGHLDHFLNRQTSRLGGVSLVLSSGLVCEILQLGLEFEKVICYRNPFLHPYLCLFNQSSQHLVKYVTLNITTYYLIWVKLYIFCAYTLWYLYVAHQHQPIIKYFSSSPVLIIVIIVIIADHMHLQGFSTNSQSQQAQACNNYSELLKRKVGFTNSQIPKIL